MPYVERAATFCDSLLQLPNVQSTDRKKALSKATNLHLTNEHQLDLISIDKDAFFICEIVRQSYSASIDINRIHSRLMHYSFSYNCLINKYELARSDLLYYILFD